MLSARAPPLSLITLLMVSVPLPPMLASPLRFTLMLAAVEAVPVLVRAPMLESPVPLRFTVSVPSKATPFRFKVPPLAVVAPVAVPRLDSVVMESMPPLTLVAPS